MDVPLEFTQDESGSASFGINIELLKDQEMRDTITA
jgi:hypothetical protein